MNFKIYNDLGPGLLESVYEAVLASELKPAGLSVKTQIGVPFIYNEISLEVGYRMDLLIEDKVVIEIKSKKCCFGVVQTKLETPAALDDR